MTDGVTIYLTQTDESIERLAQLDSARPPSGSVLVAAAAGQPIAALPLDGGPPIADPFQPTAELVSLLELRAAQLTKVSSGSRLARLFGVLRPGAHSVGRLPTGA